MNLLVIWTARNIPAAQYHAQQLTGADKLWVRGHTETEFASALLHALAKHQQYTRISVLPDDAILSQQAFDAILETAGAYPEACVSGWCNVDFTRPLAAVQTTPRTADFEYDLLTIPDIASRGVPFAATWQGMVCATMSRENWLTNPIVPFSAQEGGYGSDVALCNALTAKSIPIIVDPRAALMHLKIDHTLVDTGDDWKRLNLSDKRVELEICT